MVQTEVGIGKSMIRTEELHSADVSGVIGLSGDVAGAVVLSFPARVASKLASRFAGVELDVGQEDFSDAIGELTNMVAGNAKKDFGGLNVTISLPSVIVGAGHQVSQSSNSPQLVIPCQTLLGPFNVEVAMVVHKKSEATPAPAPPERVGAAT